MPLTHTAIRAAQPRDTAWKLFDAEGLFLFVTPSGGKLWRFNYRYHGREKLLSLGSYPEIPLKVARERRAAARALLAQDIDPSAQRKAERQARACTFKDVSLEWLAIHRHRISAATYEKSVWIFEKLLYPYIGRYPIVDLKTPDVLGAIRHTEKRGRYETAHRARSLASQVFRYAIVTGRIERDPADVLRGALVPVVTTHRAALTEPKAVGELMRAIHDYNGKQPPVEVAIRLAPLLFVRPGELRLARWEEFDLDSPEPLWRIPPERMKMRKEHLVPLPHQAVELLKGLQPLTGPTGFVFPSVRTFTRPISDNTLNAALRRMGYDKTQMTAHGFRATARTLLDEALHFRPDIIEHQLAHAVQDANGRAYNRTMHLPERRQMMQAWADYLDRLRTHAKTPGKRMTVHKSSWRPKERCV
jgi:integrase